jgi:predicted Zn-dependent protease
MLPLAHLFALLLLLVVAAPGAGAATIVRDAEIEDYLARLSEPIFKAAGVDPEAVRVRLLADDDLNAFVAGGQQLFLFTGLIKRAETPEQLAAVIAHETGHLAGGHLTRVARAADTATAEAFITALLGAAAAVAGAPELGTAIIAGGQTLAERGFLAFTRSQEQIADQAAIGYLERAGYSPRGLLEFMQILERRDLGITREGAEFLRTHPLTRNRIRFLEEQVAASPLRDAQLPVELIDAHARAVAKIEGFLDDPAEVLRRRTGEGFADRYARSVAVFRAGRVDEALALVDGLLRERPHDAYVHELRGQLLLGSGRVREAEPPYREALRLIPSSPLIRLELARVLVEQNDPARLPEARALLQEVVRLEPRHPLAWRLLGLVEGRLGNEGPSLLALTEWAVLTGRLKDAELYLTRARRQIAPESPAAIWLTDLEQEVQDLRAREERNPRRRPLLQPRSSLPN